MPRRALLYVAFALSGAAGLLTEAVFEKLLSTLLGATTPAGAVVLAVYFAGLTLGGLAYRAVSTRQKAVRFAYPILEFAVALACVALAVWFEALVPMMVPLLRLGVGRPALLTLLRASVAAGWILPLTVPMGATFPAVTDAMDRLAGGSAPRSMSLLYASNLLGAIVATVLGPVAIFPHVGMSGGLGVAAALDTVAALIGVLLIVRAPAVPAATTLRVMDNPPPAPRQLVALAFTTGFVLFALEVTWTHLAGAVVGNSVYAFAAMLASVLIGLGVGSVASALVFRAPAQVPASAPGAALLLGAIVLLAIHPAWPWMPHAVALLGATGGTFVAAELARFAVAFVVLVPPASVLGAAFPLLFRVPSFPETDRGGVAGVLTAANAVGCVVGALATGFVILPALGSEATERALVALSAVAGLGSILFAARGRAPRAAFVVTLTAVAGAALIPDWDRVKLTSGEHVYFRPQFVVEAADLKSFHEDTRGGITTVANFTVNGATAAGLFTNGKFQGSDGVEMGAQTAFALAPLLYAHHFDRALVIGLGTGRSADVVQRTGFGAVDIAEISPGIVRAARQHFGHVNDHVLDAPNVHVVLEDGRNLLLLRAESYDLIAIELSSVWFAGATNLYSREFYAIAKARLRPGGVLQQWVQLHHTGVAEISSVLAAVRSEFRYVSLFLLGGQGIIVATNDAQSITTGLVDHAAALGPGRAADARTVLVALAASRLLAPVDVDALTARPGVTLNTDGNRFLEFASPKYNLGGDDLALENLATLTALASFPPAEADPAVDPDTRAALAGIDRGRHLEAIAAQLPQ